MDRENGRRMHNDNDDAECTKPMYESTLIIVHTRANEEEKNESDTIQSIGVYVFALLYENLHVSVNEWVDIDSMCRCN